MTGSYTTHALKSVGVTSARASATAAPPVDASSSRAANEPPTPGPLCALLRQLSPYCFCLQPAPMRSLPHLDVSSKAVLLIRHGQAQHNPRSDPQWIARTMLYRDSTLTPTGVQQAEAARERLDATGWIEHLEAVLVSPMTRAVHTTQLIFGERPAPPRRLWPMLTERAWFVCDRGSPKEELARNQPYVTRAPWTGLDELERIWWPTEIELEEQLAVRVTAVKAALLERTERVLALVGHGAFFRTLIGGVKLPNATPRWAELRADGTLVLRPEWDACRSWGELERLAGRAAVSDSARALLL